MSGGNSYCAPRLVAAKIMSMRELLHKVVDEIEQMTPEEQDLVSSRILSEIAAERTWSARFAATTDLQWERMIADVEQEIQSGDCTPLDEFLKQQSDDKR